MVSRACPPPRASPREWLDLQPRKSLDGPVGIWDFYEGLGDRSREQLPLWQRGLAAICDLRQEVNAGGFDAYFRYWGGDSAPLALESLSGALGDSWAAVLRETMDLFGEHYPLDQKEREERLDELDLEDALEDLDGRYLALEASVNADSVSGFQVVDIAGAAHSRAASSHRDIYVYP